MKKGQLGLKNLGSIAVLLVVSAIIISFGGSIIGDMQDDISDTNGSAYNVTNDGLKSLMTFGGWLPTIAIILAASIIIGVIVTSFRT